MAKRKAKRNYIVVVVRDDGSISSSHDQVIEEFSGFYRMLLGTGFVS